MPPFVRDEYVYKEYLPTFPKIDYEPHVELKIDDRGHHADPEMKALLGAATRVDDLGACIGTQLDGIDLRKLTEKQKDELALLAAKRGVVVFKNQDASIYDLLDIAAYYGPLHIHSTTGVPTDPKLAGVHVVWSDGTKDFDRIDMDRPRSWHTDQPYEINPPGLTSLKVITDPPTGGDTIWSSSAAVFASFSPQFQAYLETLYALQSSEHQKIRALQAGTYIRRPQTDFVHPVVRVHPVTGMKALYINPSYTARIVGIPKAESDFVTKFIYSQIMECEDFKVRIRWSKDQVVFWDNRVLWHTATYDYYPYKRHALRATPVAERPESVSEYEKRTGEKAKNWYEEKMKALGEDISIPKAVFKPAGAD
ncbi:TauD-domain-containing protein [Calocera cornea HHB12733]|uniref:TauD-domain-containing protein n=1 Tax=Calocera cornea HHB12733 TaxID=1353952 RepID=A0A165JKS5_9BASI|nr:TauD-domain-containing protein [Calocera cornea HHB12733]